MRKLQLIDERVKVDARQLADTGIPRSDLAVASGMRASQELFFELALADVGRAADLLHESTTATKGVTGSSGLT